MTSTKNMDELLIEKSVRKMKFVLRTAGIFVTIGEKAPFEVFKYRLTYIFNFICLNTAVIGELYYFIDGIQQGKDFNALTYTAPCILISIIANSKSIFLVMNEMHVQKLVESLQAVEKNDILREKSFERNAIVEAESKFLNLAIKVTDMLHVVLVSAFAATPLILMMVKYFQTNELEFVLPFLVIYPFDPYSVTCWPIMYLHQIWTECVVSVYIRSADHLFFMSCIYLRIQFRLLKHDIESLIDARTDNGRHSDQFRKKFVELITWHQDLIESANLLETIYSKSTLIYFMSSSLVICITGFHSTVVDDTATLLTFLDFFFFSMIQVFSLCYFADLMTIASMDVSNAIYNSKWYLADADIRKELLLIQRRAQKPCKLTASGFADIDLNCFMRVLSTSWSYFALLQTMYGGRN